MADVSTYTATPCAISSGQTYEITVDQANQVPISNLAAVRVTDDPDTYICCTIDRTQTNSTPEEDVKLARDSGFALNQCANCNNHW